MTGFEPMIARRDWNRATEDDWADVLASLPLFAKVGKRRLRNVAKQAKFEEYAPGATVVSTGTPADSFFVILGGAAQAAGKPASRELGAGEYFGEMALLDEEPRSATVVATGDLHVMRVPRSAFLQLFKDDPELAVTIARELAARVRRLEQQSPRP